MKLNRTFAGPADMPPTIPLFPLAGALLLPRRPIQLTVFEPRYLTMLDDALTGERLIGIIQPTVDGRDVRSSAGALSARLRRPHRPICGDRRWALLSHSDGRGAVPPGGRSAGPRPLSDRGRRLFAFRRGFSRGRGRSGGRSRGLARDAQALRGSQRDQGGLERHQEGVQRGAGQWLVDDEPVRPQEKQALLEAPDLKSRAEMLVAITTIDLARGEDGATQIH